MPNKAFQLLKSTALYRLLRTTRPGAFFKLFPKAYADVDPAEKRRVTRLMNWAHIRYGISYLDFWRCRGDLMSWKQIGAILPYQEQKRFWFEINAPEAHIILNDKWVSYQHFGPYYRREMLMVKPDGQGASEFAGFMSRHPRFLVKPIDKRCGMGIRIVNDSIFPDGAQSLLAMYPEGFLAEELIVQDPALAQFHPESVNTLRINTFFGPDGPVVKWPCLRTGRGDSIVDNAAIGGIFGAIDVATGIIIGASDEMHHTYESHPDTGIRMVGFQIPRWEEVCRLAKELATAIPEAHFVGWDFALTPDGWEIVEGNNCPLLIWQYAAGQGIKPEFEQMKKAYGTLRNQQTGSSRRN